MRNPFSELYGPWALVTGAAHGIGRAFGDELAARGIGIVAVDMQADALASACATWRAHVDVRPLVLDLADPDFMAGVRPLVAELEIGLLVASAADVPTGPFLDASAAAHVRAVTVNVVAGMQLAHAVAGPMRTRGRGGLIFVASMAGLYGTGWVATYAATKAFDLILAEGLWWELRDAGVDVLAALPGATDTEGLQRNSPFVEDRSALAQPAAVAREALDALGKEPSWICGEQNRAITAALRDLPRAQVIDMVSSATRRMTEGPR